MSEDPKWGTMEWHRLHPLTLTKEDMTQPPEILIERMRMEISDIRSKLQDIKFGWPGYSEQIVLAESGLTLVISSLYGLRQEMESNKLRWARELAQLKKD